MGNLCGVGRSWRVGNLRGDTLVEVTLAVGIFSMVAIAVVMVVSGSTSSSQVALETTLTREEMDAQAEALRFIQSSYIAGSNANEAKDYKYRDLWRAITDLAVDDSELGNALTYFPETCAQLYNDGTLVQQNAFVINTHKMYLLSRDAESSDATNEILVKAKNGSELNSKFRAAATYPRILYGGGSGDVLYNDSSREDDVRLVEGLYVVAVKDPGTTNIVGVGAGRASAYYDFYIRSCWYGPGAEKPSTISTVIRLYDPNVIEY